MYNELGIGSQIRGDHADYLELVYLVTALVPSDTACFANSPGSRSRTAVWISREVMVDLMRVKGMDQS